MRIPPCLQENLQYRCVRQIYCQVYHSNSILRSVVVWDSLGLHHQNGFSWAGAGVRCLGDKGRCRSTHATITCHLDLVLQQDGRIHTQIGTFRDDLRPKSLAPSAVFFGEGLDKLREQRIQPRVKRLWPPLPLAAYIMGRLVKPDGCIGLALIVLPSMQVGQVLLAATTVSGVRLPAGSCGPWQGRLLPLYIPHLFLLISIPVGTRLQ